MTDPSAKPQRRWVKPLLFSSLAINLLIAGVFIGSAFAPDHRRHDGQKGGPARGFIGEPFLKALADGDRRTLVKELRKNTKSIRDTREGLRARFDEFLVVIRTEPFDTNAARSLLEDQRNVIVGRQKFGEQLLLKRLEAMTAEERTIYADRLAENLKHLKRRQN